MVSFSLGALRPRARWPLLIAAIGITEFALTLLGPSITISDGNVYPHWPPTGMALAVMLLFGYRTSVAILAGSWPAYILLLAPELNGPKLILVSGSISIGFVLQAFVGAKLIQRYIDLPTLFERAPQVITFLAIGVASCLIGATVFTLVLAAANLTPLEQFGFTIASCIAGCALSIVHITPLALLWRDIKKSILAPGRRLELAALLTFSTLASATVFTELLTGAAMPAQIYLVFPFILWAVFRFNPPEMIILLGAMSVPVLYGTLNNTGPFAGDSSAEAMLNALVYLVIGVGISMTLSTIAVQQKQAEANLRRLNGSLENRVTKRTGQLAKANESLRNEIDERRRAEKALQESQHRKTTIIDTALDCIVSIDSEGNIVDFNPAAELAFGYTKERIQAKPFTSLLISSEERKAQKLGVMCYLENEYICAEWGRRETRCQKSDRSSFWVELAVVRVNEESGVSYILYIHDMTERKAVERERTQLNRELIDASHRAGMAEIANGVLHNVGNVLNSINVSAAIVAERISTSKVDGLSRVAELLNQPDDELRDFLSDNRKGRQLSSYLSALSSQHEVEKQSILQEFTSLKANIAHIKEIIGRQQSYACQASSAEATDICELLDSAFGICIPAESDVEIRRYYDDVPSLVLDKHNVMQVLINLIENAKDALTGCERNLKYVAARVSVTADRHLRIDIDDNGVGFDKADIGKLFHYAFTTKKHGHGFGLHSSAAAVASMQGKLTANSDGHGQGATFALFLPLLDGVSDS